MNSQKENLCAILDDISGMWQSISSDASDDESDELYDLILDLYEVIYESIDYDTDEEDATSEDEYYLNLVLEAIDEIIELVNKSESTNVLTEVYDAVLSLYNTYVADTDAEDEDDQNESPDDDSDQDESPDDDSDQDEEQKSTLDSLKESINSLLNEISAFFTNVLSSLTTSGGDEVSNPDDVEPEEV